MKNNNVENLINSNSIDKLILHSDNAREKIN